MYTTPIRFSPSDGRTDFFSPFNLSLSRNFFILGDFNCQHHLWDPKGTSDHRREEVFDWVISSDLLPLNNTEISTLLHRSSGSRSSPDVFFAPSSLALSCSWEVLQDLGSDHLPILLSIPLSPIFRPNERPPFLNFQKVRWDDLTSYFDSHCPSVEEYSSFSYFSAATLFTSLALNASNSSILSDIFFHVAFSFDWQLCSCKLLDCVITFLCFELIRRRSPLGRRSDRDTSKLGFVMFLVS